MLDKCPSPIPETRELLILLKRPPRDRSSIGKIEQGCMVAGMILVVLILATAGFGLAGILSRPVTRYTLMALLVIFAATFLVWALTQIVDLFLTLKAGYRKAAAKVDEDILLERAVIASLARCDPTLLKEHGKQMDIKAKLLTRRSQMGSVLATVCAVVINLQAAGESADIWGKFQGISPVVLAGSFGVLTGSAALIMFAGQLERLSGLLLLAADRADTTRK